MSMGQEGGWGRHPTSDTDMVFSCSLGAKASERAQQQCKKYGRPQEQQGAGPGGQRSAQGSRPRASRRCLVPYSLPASRLLVRGPVPVVNTPPCQHARQQCRPLPPSLLSCLPRLSTPMQAAQEALQQKGGEARRGRGGNRRGWRGITPSESKMRWKCGRSSSAPMWRESSRSTKVANSSTSTAFLGTPSTRVMHAWRRRSSGSQRAIQARGTPGRVSGRQPFLARRSLNGAKGKARLEARLEGRRQGAD